MDWRGKQRANPWQESPSEQQRANPWQELPSDPGGFKGRDYERCHMHGELQTPPWKRARKDYIRTVYALGQADNPSFSGLPSIGSAGHATGTCKPCAYIWKKNGCEKGYNCERCHICGEREYKRYRRETKGASFFPATVPGSLPLSKPTMAPHLSAEQRGVAEEEEDESSVEDQQEAQYSADDYELPSIGSAGHADGTCRPCAFVWKAGGCRNGRDCERCHLCGEAEFRSWRAFTKGRSSAPPGKSLQPPQELYAEGFWGDAAAEDQERKEPDLKDFEVTGSEDQEQEGGAAYDDELPSIGSQEELYAEDSEVDTAVEDQEGKQPDLKDFEVTGGEHQEQEGRSLYDDELPSIGSAGHADGSCKPCAFFWKPGGCNKGPDCERCHLCDEAEVKRRNRDKARKFKKPWFPHKYQSMQASYQSPVHPLEP